MPFYVYALIGSIFGGFFVIVTKLTSKYSIKNPWLLNFLLALVNLIFTIPLAIYYRATIPNNLSLVILATISLSVANILYIIANNKLDVSVFMPLYNFKNIFAVFIGLLFFKEHIPAEKYLYVVVIFIAGVLTSLDEKFSLKSFFKSTIGVGILAVFFNSLNNAFTKGAMVSNSLWTVSFWTAVLSCILLIPTYSLFKKDLKQVDLSHVLPVLLIGFLLTVCGLAANQAYSMNLAISSIIMNLPISMIFAFLFSVFAPSLLEKHTLKVYVIRFSSVAIMIWAAMKLTK